MTVKQLLDIVDSFDWAAYNDELENDFGDVFRHILVSQGHVSARSVGLGTFHDNDPFVKKRLTEYVGERIVSLNDTTKEDVSQLIRTVMDDASEEITVLELSDRIAEKVREGFTGYQDWRADRIGRTETSIAYNFGDIFGYRQAGVTHVLVSDGDGDAECAAANGQTWTLEEALNNPVAHPHCERSFSPIVDDQ